jgi:hypothetical protein
LPTLRTQCKCLFLLQKALHASLRRSCHTSSVSSITLNFLLFIPMLLCTMAMCAVIQPGAACIQNQTSELYLHRVP